MLRNFETRGKLKVSEQNESINTKLVESVNTKLAEPIEYKNASNYEFKYSEPNPTSDMCNFDNTELKKKNTENYKLSIAKQQEDLLNMKNKIDANIESLNYKLQQFENNN
jgi:hypothetical protein